MLVNHLLSFGSPSGGRKGLFYWNNLIVNFLSYIKGYFRAEFYHTDNFVYEYTYYGVSLFKIMPFQSL